jgi:energy-converting hydrogenase Eha subunit E
VLGEAPFVGHEEGLIRLAGLLVVVIGTFQTISGRADQRSAIATSIVLRCSVVPVALIVLGASGVFPRALYAFAVIDPVLAAGAWGYLSAASR